VPERDALDTIRTAVRGGIRDFDTAPHYGSVTATDTSTRCREAARRGVARLLFEEDEAAHRELRERHRRLS
jgi:aryl-alcohol dehydrogenase-like predicted oxidoreductase